jgi:hypothetical protein
MPMPAGLSLSGEDDGWAYTVKAAPLPDKLNLDLDVSRKYNGLIVKVTGSRLRAELRDRRHHHGQGQPAQVLRLSKQEPEWPGELRLGSGQGRARVEALEQKIKLPSSFTIPLPIGGCHFRWR